MWFARGRAGPLRPSGNGRIGFKPPYFKKKPQQKGHNGQSFMVLPLSRVKSF